MIKLFMSFILFTSPFKSFFSSLLVPGYSQIKNGNKRGYVYVALEGGSLFYLLVSHIERNSVMQDARIYAYSNAGCYLPGYINEDWTIVEKHISYDEYVEYLYREARQFYPDDPEKQDEYVAERIPTFKWSWNSIESLYCFQDKMQTYRSIGNRITAITGFILLNHLASGIDAFISEKLKEKKVDVSLNYLPGKTSVTLSYKF